MSGLWELAHYETGTGVMTPGNTVPEIFLNAVKARGDQVWMREKKLGIWREWTWRRVGEQVREVSMGLAALGFEPGHCASVLANTMVEWVVADLGTLCAGGVTNGIYPTDSQGQVEYLCTDSETRIIFVEDDEQLDKVLSVRERLPLLQWIVVFDTEGLQGLKDPQVISLEALREKGRAHDKAHPGLFEERSRCRTPEDLAVLVYTSGTTGKPKGAMHLHKGLVFAMQRSAASLPQSGVDERMCFLPLCHIFERMAGAYVSLYAGSRLNFVENPDTVAENIREISPTVFAAVPRVWEKFYSGVIIGVRESTRLQQLIYAWSIGVGGQVVDAVLAGQSVPGLLKLKFRLARFLVLDNVRKLIGIHRARLVITAAAPISPDLIRWYLSLGIPMLEAWGMTETCALGSLNRPNAMRLGTIGTPVEGLEMRIDPATGEILARGQSIFAGYLNLPEKTAETIDADGWLHTGDVGLVDEQGYFRITDRMKDIIITAGGKNITPSEFENELKFSPYVSDAVVIGDKRPYLTALIMIDQENVEKFAQDNDIPFSNFTSLTRAREVQDLIQLEIDRVNAKFARVEQVKAFRLLETQLTAEDEELTATMKLKRNLVQKKYAALIEGMYKGSA
ncbi:MAG: long-chain fatty acid--CoA ligase [Rubrivivax sp.]|jgi:long-chain acyl-CoA synthetase|nr:long-chain fatty acid--CoA ligase [Rubrivivax sp.]